MSTAGPPFISVRNLHKQIGDQQILRGINLSIHEGENLVIIGGSGTGKSVFLKLVMGLIPATSGSIIVDNTEITKLNERQLGPHRRKIGMLFQDGALFDSLTVAENVAFPLRESGMKDSPDMHSRIHEVLAAVGLADHGHKLPAALSGGMRKRAALARAVVSRPRCIFYDEPTAGLDPIVSDSIDRLIRRTQLHYRCTSVVVTHDMRSVYFREGLIHFEGSPDQLFSSTDPLVRQFVEGHCDEDE